MQISKNILNSTEKDNIFKNKEKDNIFKNNYMNWKLEALDNSGYFIIFQGLLENDILNKISGNALKLYIYLGINSNNINGVVWHSNAKIASYFGKSERTIRTWMKELDDLFLIKRMRLNYDSFVFTYLQPYSFKKNIENVEKNRVTTIYAELIIDNIGALYIKDNNNYFPVTSNMSIEIYDKHTKKWVIGKIEIKKREYNINTFENIADFYLKVDYIFREKNSKRIIPIEKNNNLSVRVMFL